MPFISDRQRRVMLLLQEFPDPQLNLTLELFLRMLVDFWQERLAAVILHGSILFDDLAPGYGDLDFVAVVTGEVADELHQPLVALRQPLRSGGYGILAAMLEGAFLPREMLDPAHTGRAFWWGTGGERPWAGNQLGWLALEMIRERGLVIWGEDVRREIPRASRECLVEDIRRTIDNMRLHGHGGTLHAVDWLLMAARLLLWLQEGRFSSKSESADWGYLHAKGSWREYLPRAKYLRLNPSAADSADVQKWLAELTEPIGEACAELEWGLAE